MIAADHGLRMSQEPPLHRSATVPLDPCDGAADGFRRVLANLAGAIHDNLPGAIDGTDPEHLHDLRVAVRRTRSVLAEAKGILPEEGRKAHRTAFRWLGSVTGPVRDLDVHVLGWDDAVAPLSATDQAELRVLLLTLTAHRAEAHRHLREVLTSDATTELLGGWSRWLAEAPSGGKPLGRVVAACVGRAQATVLHDGRAIHDQTPGEALHDLRKDAKRLRYLLECFGSLFPAKPHRAFVQQLKALQDNLGTHQDAEAQLHELAAARADLTGRVGTGTLEAMDHLAQHLEERRHRERAEFAARFRAYDTEANRRVLAKLRRRARGT